MIELYPVGMNLYVDEVSFHGVKKILRFFCLFFFFIHGTNFWTFSPTMLGAIYLIRIYIVPGIIELYPVGMNFYADEVKKCL